MHAAEMEKGYNLMEEDCKPPTQEAPANGDGSSDANVNSGDSSSQDSIHHRLASLCDQARERLEAVGRDSFFG